MTVFLNSDGRTRSSRRDRHPPPLPCRGCHQGWPVCRCYDSNLPSLAFQWPIGQIRCCNDRRDHAQGAGAAGELELSTHTTINKVSVVLTPGLDCTPQVGGIKDKVLAAHRAGVKCIILPKRNEKDLEELPSNVRADLDFVTATNLDEVLNTAFDGGFPGTASKSTHPQLISKL